MSSFAFHARLFILNNRFFFLKFTKSVVFPVPCQHPSDRFNITFLALSNNGASSHFFIPQTFKNCTYLYYSIVYGLFGVLLLLKKRVLLNLCERSRTKGRAKGYYFPMAAPSRRGSAAPSKPFSVMRMACKPEFKSRISVLKPIFSSAGCN